MAKDFIQKAIKRPGALRAKAKRAGGLTKSGTIKKSYLSKAAKSTNPQTRKQAQLAKTLSKLRKKK